MADITNTNTIPKYNLAFGKNIISLYDLDEEGPQYYLEIRDDATDASIASYRQLNNLAGYAHFDVKTTLQNQLDFSDTIETITNLKGSPDETYRWYGAFGYINPTTNVSSIQGITASKITIGGRKEFDVLDWDFATYLPTIGLSTIGGVITATMQKKGLALTDYTNRRLGSTITDGRPTWVLTNEFCYEIDRLADEPWTLSYLNGWNIGTPSTPEFTRGIAGFRVAIYNGSTLLVDQHIQNIISNGGGPNTSLPLSGNPDYPYDVITIQGGSLLTLLSSYPTLTHYYIAPFYSQTGATANNTFYMSSSAALPFRFNVVQEECNDFDQVQVSWVNSFGFRDYFTFSKRTDETRNVERNIYQKLDANWSGAEITVDSYNRGLSIYSQNYDDEFTIRTKYLKDWEMRYLKNLILSPNVRVRFKGQSDWYSVIPITNSWVEKTYRKDKLFQLEYKFKLANKMYSQKS